MTINRTKPERWSVPCSVRRCTPSRETIIWSQHSPRMPRLWPVRTSTPRSLRRLRTYRAFDSRYGVIRTFGAIGARKGVVSRACQSILRSADTVIVGQPDIHGLGEGASGNKLSTGRLTAYDSTIFLLHAHTVEQEIMPTASVASWPVCWATVWSPMHRSVISLHLRLCGDRTHGS